MEQLPLFDTAVKDEDAQLVAAYNDLVTHSGSVVDLLHKPQFVQDPAVAATVWAAAIERRQVPGVKEYLLRRRKFARWVLLKAKVASPDTSIPVSYWSEALKAVQSGQCDIIQLRTILDVLHPTERINNNSVFPRVVRWKVRESIVAFDLLPSEKKRNIIRKAVRGYVKHNFPTLKTTSPWYYHYQIIAEGHLLRRMGWIDETDPANKFDKAREERFLVACPVSGRAAKEHKDLPESIRRLIHECLDRPHARQAAIKERKKQERERRWEQRREERLKSPEKFLHEVAAYGLADYIERRISSPETQGEEDSQQ